MTWCDRCANLGIITLFEGDLFVGEQDCLCRDDACNCDGCSRNKEREYDDD